ncbi:hypothetical protein PQQ99_36895 [Paraburkholderia sediminicola]|uniref:hypothetical protein n=1 Tax=Paraburkholderia sediminicola TaxID=458836 RepID=UPI0038BC17B8
MGGADRGLAIASGTLTILLCYSSTTPAFLVVGVGLHWLLRWKSSKDPWWRLLTNANGEITLAPRAGELILARSGT